MPANDLFLTIDQGGHTSRSLIFNRQGEVLAHESEKVSTDNPKEGWVEHDPEKMVLSVERATKKAVDAVGDRAKDILAAGLSTQRSNITCWDNKTGKALSPIISWRDRRAAPWIERFLRHEAAIHQKTGLFPTAHYGVSKLRWCFENLSAVKKAYADDCLSWGPMASFLLFRMLDQHPLLVDPANASRTLLWNFHSLNWDKELLNLFKLPEQPLPRSVPTRYCFGDINVSGKKIPLQIVTGDQSAALFAYGRPNPETAYINIGTGAFVQRPFKEYTGGSSKLLTSIVLQNGNELTYVLEGTVNGAGSALAKVEEELGLDPVETKQQLPEWLKNAKSPPLFLNGVSGLGTPFWIPDFKSQFVGNGKNWEKIVGVIESIVFLLCVNIDEMQKLSSPPEKILISGGLSALNGLCQKLTDLSGIPIYRPVEYEATSVGTAYLLRGQPNEWQETKQGVWFKPIHKPELEKRFKQWLNLMNNAILEQNR
ncbi:MAG TPA: FGGY family carbohydrate kinase [Nitrospinota bacterium]|nr:FGGY family carbohydrate kinase [Nitrospinota bacterium]